MSRVRFTSLRWMLAFAPLACQANPDARDAPTSAAPSAAPSSAGSTAEPWQYTPALRAAVPPGVVVEPVFELADGHRGRAQIGVAVGSGTRRPRLEVWDFDQNNPRERLERLGEARELVDLDGAGGRAEIDAVRKAIARPGNEYVRPRGLDGPPEAMLAELGRLARRVPDGKENLEKRVMALARLVRALDDHVLFERDMLPALLKLLQERPLAVARTEPLGERRMRLVLQDPPHVLEFARSGERWVISEVELVPDVKKDHSSAPAAPAAEPSPTAP